jgi:hypothetical protein
MCTYNTTDLSEGCRDAGRRSADVVYEDLGNNLELYGILLQLLLRVDSRWVKLEIQILGCEHQSLNNLLKGRS